MSLCAQNNSDVSMNTSKRTLIACFSRADENYAVGNIEKGNTMIVAEMIAEQTNGTLFHIETLTPYPAAYDPCIKQAKKELQDNARPEIKGDINVEDFDIIFIGYPNWWGEPPMALYTFIEKHNWQGKTIIPFITHEGSGFGGTDKRVAKACHGATMLPGIAIYGHDAQNNRDKTLKAVLNWLNATLAN